MWVLFTKWPLHHMLWSGEDNDCIELFLEELGYNQL